MPIAREKIILSSVLVLLAAGFVAWRHNPFSDRATEWADRGCYSDAPAVAWSFCEEPHSWEIIGFVKADRSDRVQTCRATVEAFVGGPLIASRIRYDLLEHVEDHTSLACSVSEASGPRGAVQARAGTLKGSMRGERPAAAITCMAESADAGRAWKRCGEFHTAELVGLIPVPEVCRSAVDGYTTASDAEPLILDTEDPAQLLCFAMTPERRDPLPRR